MRAVVYQRRGDAAKVLKVVDLPDPEPDTGEVKVRIVTSGINPSDVKSRAGASAEQSGRDDPLPFPYQVPHQDGAGIIEGVGPEVDPALMGTAVWVYNAAFKRQHGTAADFVCLPREQVVPLPAGVPMGLGAGLGIPFITAHRCLLAGGDIAGATVLVTGGAGAVGNAAVQLARFHEAKVLATVSSEQKAEIARAAGAHATIDYRADDVAVRLRALAPEGVDRVVDVSLTTNLPSYFDTLNSHAEVAAYAESPGAVGPAWPPPMQLRVRNVLLRFVRAYGLTVPMVDAALADINRALHADALRPLPEQRFPLEEVAAAHEAVEQGAVGKVLLELG